MSSYKSQFQQILGNLILLYKNFFHWNISKVCVFLYANILGFLVSSPFIGGIVYQYFTIYNQLGLASSPEQFILSNVGAIIITALLMLCIVTIFICTYTYGNFLMMNVYKSYLEGEKLAYTKNLYFSRKYFSAYMGVLGWISLYMLAPLLTGVVLVFPLGFLAKTVSGNMTVVLGIVSFVILLSLVVWFFHLIVRVAFSYYALLYSTEVGKSKVYVDESFRLTKKKVWKIVWLVLPFLIVTGVAGGIIQSGEGALTQGRVYSALVEVQKQSGQDDHQLLEGFYFGSESSKEDFKKVEAAFSPMKTDINKDFLSASMGYINVRFLDTNGWMFTTLFVLFSFFVLEGLSSMVYLSVYQIIVKLNEEQTAK